MPVNPFAPYQPYGAFGGVVFAEALQRQQQREYLENIQIASTVEQVNQATKAAEFELKLRKQFGAKDIASTIAAREATTKHVIAQTKDVPLARATAERELDIRESGQKLESFYQKNNLQLETAKLEIESEQNQIAMQNANTQARQVSALADYRKTLSRKADIEAELNTIRKQEVASEADKNIKDELNDTILNMIVTDTTFGGSVYKQVPKGGGKVESVFQGTEFMDQDTVYRLRDEVRARLYDLKGRAVDVPWRNLIDEAYKQGVANLGQVEGDAYGRSAYQGFGRSFVSGGGGGQSHHYKFLGQIEDEQQGRPPPSKIVGTRQDYATRAQMSLLSVLGNIEPGSVEFEMAIRAWQQVYPGVDLPSVVQKLMQNLSPQPYKPSAEHIRAIQNAG